MTRCVRIIVTGRVQGVGYRAWTAGEAEALGLEGYVRNRRDGGVEAVLAGPDEAVARMIERMRQGPPSARVTALTEDEVTRALLDLRRGGEAFSMLPTV